MKAYAACFLTVLGLLFAGFAAHAEPILLNGDFSDGKTHWHGDGAVADTGGSLTVTLKPDKWTVVSQNFSASSTQLRLKITYSYSADCSLAKKRSDDALVPPLTALELEQATGMANNIGTINLFNTSSWMVLMVSGGRYRGQHAVYDQNSTADPKTYSATLSEWSKDFDREDLCLAFPPGKGSVTIKEVKLLPPGDPVP